MQHSTTHARAVASHAWWAPGALVLRLMLLALLALALAGAGAAWMVQRAGGVDVVQPLAQQQGDEVQLYARLLAGKVEHNQKMLTALAAGITPAQWDNPASLSTALHPGVPGLRFFDSLLLARTHGELRVLVRDGDAGSVERIEAVERDCLRRTLADGKPQVCEPFAAPGGQIYVLFTTLLRQGNGSVLGALGGTVLLQSQALLPPALALPERAGVRLVVFTRTGTVLSHPVAGRILSAVTEEPGLGAVSAQWLQGAQPVQDAVQTVLLGDYVVSVAGMPLAQWLVARVSDVRSVQAVSRQALLDGWWAVCALLCVLALLLLLGMAWLAQPLAQLQRTAAALLPEGRRTLQPSPRARGEVDALVQVLHALSAQREQWRAQAARLQSQWQVLLEQAPVGIVMTQYGRLQILSRQAGHLLGYAVEDLRGQSVRALYPSEADFAQWHQRARDAFRVYGAFDHDVCLVRKDGGRVWARVQGYRLGVGGGTLWLLQDLTAERAAWGTQGWEALQDPLTLLPNRQALELRLGQLLWQARQKGEAVPGVLLFLDVDHFSAINDEAGHEAGNDILRHLARLIDAQSRPAGWAARVGGDVFAVVLPGATLEYGHTVAERLRTAVQACAPAYQGRSYALSASVGLVPLQGEAQDAVQALQAADMACYAAKRMVRHH